MRGLVGVALCVGAALGATACSDPGGDGGRTGTRPETHSWFPITSGTHALGRMLDDGPIACESCHAPEENSFRAITCFNCHTHAEELTNLLHGSAPVLDGYEYSAAKCYGCHPAGEKVPFIHTGIVTGEGSRCGYCHAPDGFYAALPVPGLDHSTITPLPKDGGPDCGACHVTTTWRDATGAPRGAFDPDRSVLITALIPTYSGAEITAVTPRGETLTMPMDHAAPGVPESVRDDCAACHPGAGTGALAKGDLHRSLAARGLPAPTTCLACHSISASMPVGFVGPEASARTPPSGEMKHDAVVWSGGAPTTTPAFEKECSTCHAPPTASGGTWSVDVTGTGPARYHASLARASMPERESCIDCHANSRPNRILDRTNATLPPGASWSFDHSAAETKAECAMCHAASIEGGYSSWAGGRYHLPGHPAPRACTPCHEGERPTSTSGWQTPGFDRSPFDYGTNARGITHGDALDCATCHPGPGTGAWGSSQNWQNGHFVHDPNNPPASMTCRDCHMSQRPDLLPGTTPAAVAALLGGFDHAVSGTGECRSCHLATTRAGSYVDYFSPATGRLPGGDWRGATNTPSDAWDPQASITVTALLPTFSGTTITALRSDVQTLPMHMDHATPAISAATLAACADCHVDAAIGVYYPGVLHQSLEDHGVPQPSECRDCHTASMPTGFVGPLATHPARTPPSGEMMHDAVDWQNNVRTATPIVTRECGVCHVSPGATAATWATNVRGSTPAEYHASLTRAGLSAPSSCLDCHANSRPSGVLRSPAASLPAGVSFDHGSPAAMADCRSCHTASSSPYTAWTDGRYHLAGSTTPATCVPCHEGERPTSSMGWRSTTYQDSPFDYGTNPQGHQHGDEKDCVVCHAGPGTGGAWGVNASWVGGHFMHGPASAPEPTCLPCHTSQRPDLQPGTTAAAMAALLGFDHAVNGTGDCVGCHQATVLAGNYRNYVNPVTHTLPNGDWAGGVEYPGSELTTSPMPAFTLMTIELLRSPGARLVYGTTTHTQTFYDAMLHTSAAIPAAIAPGPTAAPSYDTCWHCHQSTGTVVTSYSDGDFHSALDRYSTTPGGPQAPLPQPTSHCEDCHAVTSPTNIVERAGSNLRAMDHAALFTTSVTIGGVPALGVADLDCSACHASTTNWADGVFHTNIAAATPVDCTGCHYPLMADTAASDKTQGPTYAMHHASAAITDQACDHCHRSALQTSAVTNVTAAAWSPGTLHGGVQSQPTECASCHSISAPASATQSTVTYVLARGGTATNGGQWMNHGSARLAGRDCALCHQADARTTGSAWSRSAPLHSALPGITTCQECHGVGNGNGTTAGTRNNIPSGLTSSSMVSTASQNAATGVPAGTHDEITHADVNVTGLDCVVCHTQVGPSSVPGVQGTEWAVASFHANFGAGRPLVMNGSTGRCSNCHLNVKPGPSYTALDHSPFTATSAQDCASCHTFPGTGTAASPNWQGATPTTITVGGFTIPQPPATSPGTVQVGITNLPHPSPPGTTCSSCHINGVGGTGAIGYDHASPLINTRCNACHEAGSNLVGTVWNGATNETMGAGDTRPTTLTSVTAVFHGNTRRVTWPNHFYPVDCKECHLIPAGLGYVQTGTLYRTASGAWGNNRASTSLNFPHNENVMTNPSTCLMCHNPIPN